jgi:hypothetical protein
MKRNSVVNDPTKAPNTSLILLIFRLSTYEVVIKTTKSIRKLSINTKSIYTFIISPSIL